MADGAPSVELLLPFYGDPDLLRETITSVLDQTDPDWTLTVVDDGYPDPGVEAWIRGLADDRITYHRNETNLGANGNYRKAISLATAEFIVVLGADDRLRPRYLARARTLLRDGGVDVLHPGVAVIDQDGAVVRPLGDRIKGRLRPGATATPLRGEQAVRTLMHGNWTYFPSIVWRRSLVAERGLRPFEVVQDLALLVDLLVDGATLLVDSEVTFDYRRHAGSDSSVKALSGERFAEEAGYYQQISRELSQRGWTRAATAARSRWTSRLHAVSLLPRARSVRGAAAMLARHAFGGWR
jgi:glycosyltransferase involved in cell wall biosynthesis